MWISETVLLKAFRSALPVAMETEGSMKSLYEVYKQ